jgi:hypothetical protein
MPEILAARPARDNARFLDEYIFPAVGTAIYATNAKRATDEMFIEAAHAVADQVTPKQLKLGTLFPPQSNIPGGRGPDRSAGSQARLRCWRGPRGASSQYGDIHSAPSLQTRVPNTRLNRRPPARPAICGVLGSRQEGTRTRNAKCREF